MNEDSKNRVSQYESFNGNSNSSLHISQQTFFSQSRFSMVRPIKPLKNQTFPVGLRPGT
jgi:hypothetical protein